MPYLDNYWSFSFGPKCDPPVFGVLHLPKYFGNLSNFISHAIPNFQKHRSLTVATLSELMNYQVDWSEQFVPGVDSVYKFEAYIVEAHGRTRYANRKDVIICACPIAFLVPRLTSAHLRNVAAHHNVFIGTNCTVLDARNL